MERRKIEAPVEMRGEDRRVAGYGAVFNSETTIGGAFREVILPGAFKRALAGDVFSFFNHDASQVLGRTKAGTLHLREDENGLHYEVDLPDTSAARDLRVSMERGDVDGSSFMFDVPKGGDTWEFPDDGLPLRTIRDANLYEVGPVTMPAYPDANAALRSMESAKSEVDKAGQAERNAAAAKARIAARKAEAEQKFRGIK